MSTLLCIVGRHDWENPKFSKEDIKKCSFAEFQEIFWETDVKCKRCKLPRSLRNILKTEKAKARGEELIKTYYESVKGPEDHTWHAPSQRAAQVAELLAELGL